MVADFAVLVVDDDPLVRASTVSMFEELGLVVFDAYNGRDALRLLSHRPEIGLLFADVRMPSMAGPELAEAARRLRPDLKVVFTSGYVDAIALPPDMIFVPKPVTKDALARAVLDQRSAR